VKYAVITNRESGIQAPMNFGWWQSYCLAGPELPDVAGCRYVFFPFWSHKVPKEITDNYECVCFHMADLPYGRGGSPLQNLILRGHTETVITALRMTDEMDAGPVYMKRPMHLKGSAQEIYNRAAILIKDMMQDIARTEPIPVPQVGEVVTFKRREPWESEIPGHLLHGRPHQLYDFIRMLDADGYPKAFIRKGNAHIQFIDAECDDHSVTALAIIS
jgi:methionyl-tRNA formyltransferase